MIRQWRSYVSSDLVAVRFSLCANFFLWKEEDQCFCDRNFSSQGRGTRRCLESIVRWKSSVGSLWAVAFDKVSLYLRLIRLWVHDYWFGKAAQRNVLWSNSLGEFLRSAKSCTNLKKEQEGGNTLMTLMWVQLPDLHYGNIRWFLK